MTIGKKVKKRIYCYNDCRGANWPKDKQINSSLRSGHCPAYYRRIGSHFLDNLFYGEASLKKMQNFGGNSLKINSNFDKYL